MPNARTVRTVVFTIAAILLVAAVLYAADSGSKIYASKCASCHHADGSGKTAAGKKMLTPDLRSKQIVEMSDQEMFETIGRGTKHRNYPHSFLYTGLNEQQVRSLVTHIRQLQEKK